MLINRIGDVSLALGVCSVFLIFKTVEFAPVFAMIPSAFDKTLNFFFFEISAITGLCLLLFGGVLGKSAQISLHV
jgi:NADH-quinone oxidoreductase subunit L